MGKAYAEDKPIHILIVDDEAQSRLLIRQLLTRHTIPMSVDEGESVSSGIASITEKRPDILFLDVQLRGETGFDLLDRVTEAQIPVIFITAYSDFAVKAFRYHALDYLLKPIDPVEFDEAFRKTLHNVNAIAVSERYGQFKRHLESAQAIPEKIAVPTTEGYLFVDTQDILYCKATGNYTELIMTGKQKILSSHTLGYYEDLLSGHHFFRIHRSYLVNLRHIRKYKRLDGGTVEMQDGMEIEVSRTNKEAFLKLFKA